MPSFTTEVNFVLERENFRKINNKNSVINM